MRTLPFFKPKNKPQFAGLNVSDASSGGGGGGGGSDESISYDETEVGNAPDGKKLYKKTVNISKMSTSSNLHEFNHNIANISKVWRFYGYYYYNGTKQMQGRVENNDAILTKVTNSVIMYYNTYYDNSADVTIYYTKTID